MKPEIIIFYHVYAVGNWIEIVQEQLAKMKSMGLYDECLAVYVRIIGDEEAIKQFRNIIIPYKKIHITKADNMNDHEAYSLWSAWYFASEFHPFRGEAEANILYFHTKGVTHSEDSCKEKMEDWRHFMEYFLIEKWQDCMERLKEHDTVGVNYRVQPFPFGSENMVGHYSGNFWWARSSYIYKLPEFKWNGDFAEFEFWIGKGKPNYYNLKESGVDHYHELYPREKYATSYLSGQYS